VTIVYFIANTAIAVLELVIAFVRCAIRLPRHRRD
jgi:hypothetical protein